MIFCRQIFFIRGKGLPRSFRAGLLVFTLILTGVLAHAQTREFNEGRIRLVINEYTGRYSLFYLTNESQNQYEPLFSHQDTRTSFIAVNVNDRIYRLGESSSFKTSVQAQGENPVVVFVSQFLEVKQIFSFIKTSGSPVCDGIKITVQIENISGEQAMVGLRMLIDTSLGEGWGKVPFYTEKQSVTGEIIIPRSAGSGASGDKLWFSRGERASLMGSIVLGGEKNPAPDLLHFANWKKLYDIPWKAVYSQGRNFNMPPYSINDSAVSYYFEPVPLAAGNSLGYSICLGAENPLGFAAESAVVSERDIDMRLLNNLLEKLDQYLSGLIVMNEEDLAAIEQTISQIKNRYGLR